MIKLTIVIPAFNSEKFIGRLLDNLIMQIARDELPCEIIIVNDGSTDNTKQIVEEKSQKFDFIRLINQINRGESGARNTGIENARGEYIYFLDSDDSLKEGSLKHFIQIINKEPMLDLYCFSYTSTENGKQSKTYRNKKINNIKFDKNEFLKNYLAKYLPIHVCSCVIKKQLIEKNNLRFTLGLKIGADIEWLLNVANVIETAYFSNQICFIYQIRNDSIMQGYKTYSMTQYNSFAIRRDIVLSKDFQTPELTKYSNFWIENQLLSNIVYYLKSSVNDIYITRKLIDDLQLLKRPISSGSIKNFSAILFAKVLPMKLIIKLVKKG